MAEAAQAAVPPEWDLTDLYPGPDSGALRRDLDEAARGARAFKERHAGRVAALSGAELGRAIAEYERLDEIVGRIMSYAQLVYAADMSSVENGRFHQSMRERATEIAGDLLFLTLEVNRIGDDALEDALAAPELARYRPWLRDVRAFRPHQLSDELEEMLLEKSVAGRGAWVRLFDETMAGLSFEVGDETLTTTGALDRLSHKDAAMREAAARAISRTLSANARLFALITNTLAKDKEVEDKRRGHSRPVSARNRENRVEDEVVDALAGAVADAYPRLSHRYYALKAGWFGVEALDFWDRNAPLPDDDDTAVSWDDARRIVLDAYAAFSPRMAGIGRRFFDGRWIDAGLRPGKVSGAFSHPVTPGAHPYILMNFQGRARDVTTLAHELGHGVHQVLAGRQGHLMADTPLTLAETASVFGEMLTFRSMLDARRDPAARRVMLASKVEGMLNTVVRQIAFHRFETRLHDARREGELTPDAIADIWMEVQGESLGPAIRFDDDYRIFWSYIPHFVHSPFYVYAYAFGDCLVNSLYAVYRDSERGFAEKYLAMLEAGGTLRHKELLAPFGLDAGDPAFWRRGLSVIEGFIDELEAA